MLKFLFLFYIKSIRRFVSFFLNLYYFIRIILSGKVGRYLEKQKKIYYDISKKGWECLLEYSARTKYEYDGVMGFPDWSNWHNMVAFYKADLLKKKSKDLLDIDYADDCDGVVVVARYLKVYLNSNVCREEHKGNKIELYSVVSDNLMDLPKFHVICFFYKDEDNIKVFSNGRLEGNYKRDKIADKYIKGGYLIKL